MNSLALRVITGFLTFVIGVGVATAWVFNKTEPTINPVETSTDSSPTLEMVFVLDTTGSMGGLLEGAKQRIWGIVNDVMQTSSHPSVKVGLVAFRDRGDQYVTHVVPLTDDLDQVYTTLMNYDAAGGGDTEENVRRALADAVEEAGWSKQSRNLAQVIFLVGDAPPHNDYRNERDTLESARIATERGMVVNTIQCGDAKETRIAWEAIAQHGQGRYFAIPQSGGVVRTIATPYDEQLSQLATKLGNTYMSYGGGAGVAGESYREAAKTRATAVETEVVASAPLEGRVERSINKAVNSRGYIGDLLQDIENGSKKLDSVKTEDLPSDLQKLSTEERAKEVEKRLAERREIRNQILSLSKQRTEFISAEQKKRGGTVQNGFDIVVSSALKEQLAKKGIK
jgi:Mg-chelatase subunit ChlD